MLTLVLTALLCLATESAFAQDLNFGYTPAPGPKENPALLVTPTRTVTAMYVSIEVGGKTLEFNKKNLPAGQQVRFEWPRDASVTHADAFIRATFSDGNVTETNVPIDYQFKGQLSVDLSRASADLEAKTVTVMASAVVDEAEIVAYGAHKAELDRRVVAINAGPGSIAVPFVGNPAEVVLLDVTLKSGNAWSGFTYSPWFLNIPHDDVLFTSDSAAIAPAEEYKLESTLVELRDVLDKYGAIVPVKLYIAGCTDTVGDAAHNKDLSYRRAQSIAGWLRAKGYQEPIFYYGFGESLLAAQTGDGVDNPLNRRALYMVGANPPPPGSGVPGASWKPL
ncbi:MAG: OmpA family protein [Pseudomonadota bacterium]|nr:OmpA family protein [Pseudomonadota bacterium]